MTEDRDESARRAADDWPTQQAPLELPVSATLRAAPGVGERVGKYVVERTIGHGGMGIVVAARHETLDEMVAIKLLHPKAAKDALQVERFVREARATVRIKSEHVVRVLDAGAVESTGAPFIVMELLEGDDLGHMLSHFGPVPAQTAVDYIIQICEGLAAAHALGIVHRDLKPSNFFLTARADGTPLVKVLDFGISKAAQSDGSPDPRLTETQAVFGSPTYMSPEQIRSSKNVDARSDVWSLGVALFELLTGKLPFMADNVAGLLASVIADPPFPVSSFVSGIPPELEAIVLGCLEKNASRRIGSAAELAMRLAPFASPDCALLATRVERSARIVGGPPSIPAPLAAGSLPAPPLSARTAHMTPAVPLAPPSYPSAPAPAVAYGSTGTDLSATGPAAFRANVRRGSGRGIALVLGALALVGALGGLVYVGVSGRGASRAASSAGTGSVGAAVPTPSAVATPSSASGAAEVVEPPLAAPVPVPSASPGTHRKPGAAGHPVTRASAVATAPAASARPPAAAPPATPSASPMLDSRF